MLYLDTFTLYHTCPKSKQEYSTSCSCAKKTAGCVANSVDLDQMPHSMATDVGYTIFSGLSVQIPSVYFQGEISSNCEIWHLPGPTRAFVSLLANATFMLYPGEYGKPLPKYYS